MIYAMAVYLDVTQSFLRSPPRMIILKLSCREDIPTTTGVSMQNSFDGT